MSETSTMTSETRSQEVARTSMIVLQLMEPLKQFVHEYIDPKAECLQSPTPSRDRIDGQDIIRVHETLFNLNGFAIIFRVYCPITSTSAIGELSFEAIHGDADPVEAGIQIMQSMGPIILLRTTGSEEWEKVLLLSSVDGGDRRLQSLLSFLSIAEREVQTLPREGVIGLLLFVILYMNS